MADLRLIEAGVLKEFLADPDGRLALMGFFAEMASQHTVRAVSYLTAYDQQNALEHAFFANCYQQGFSALEDFAKKQYVKASS